LNYYVYYKVDPSRLEEVRTQVEKLFAAVEHRCGVRGRWMRRRDDPATYMEVYEGVSDEKAFEDALLQGTKSFPFPRKVERFQCA
jgi:quinol monooxygenase YgiN